MKKKDSNKSLAAVNNVMLYCSSCELFVNGDSYSNPHKEVQIKTVISCDKCKGK